MGELRPRPASVRVASVSTGPCLTTRRLLWLPICSSRDCQTPAMATTPVDVRTLTYQLKQPTASGIFTLLNDLRMQNGGSPLGFLNPLIYENAAAFNGITTGSSNSCGGWPAKAGWDAVTGVGTPDFAKLARGVRIHEKSCWGSVPWPSSRM